MSSSFFWESQDELEAGLHYIWNKLFLGNLARRSIIFMLCQNAMQFIFYYYYHKKGEKEREKIITSLC